MKKFVLLIAIILAFYSYSSKADYYLPTNLKAVGNAVISTQQGKTIAEKSLMAVRSARMDAQTKLLDQMKSIQIDTNITFGDVMVHKPTFKVVVMGIVRGANTLRINKKGDDAYEVIMEIDKDMFYWAISRYFK